MLTIRGHVETAVQMSLPSSCQIASRDDFPDASEVARVFSATRAPVSTAFEQNADFGFTEEVIQQHVSVPAKTGNSVGTR